MAFTKLTKQLAIAADATATFTFDGTPLCDAGPPTLVVRHAGSSNVAYLNAALRAANENRGRAAVGKVTRSKLRQSFDEDAELIAAHCVVSWENVVEDDGKPAPCTPEKVLEFLMAILDAEGGEDVFFLFRNFCKDADNFRAPSGSAAGLGKG